MNHNTSCIKKEAKHRRKHTLGFVLCKTQDQLEWCLLSGLGICKKTIAGGFLEVARKCVLISECSYQVEHTGKSCMVLQNESMLPQSFSMNTLVKIYKPLLLYVIEGRNL